MRSPLAKLVLAFVITIGAALAARDLQAATRNSTVRCTAGGLVVWLDTRAGAAAGSAYYKLELTNLSGRACTLRGYPGVSGVDLQGRRLGSPASRDPAQAPRTVKLAPGAAAVATLRIVDVLNYPAPRCGRVTAAGLRVYPPGDTGARVVPFPFQGCSRAGVAYLSVRAVRHA